MIQKCLKTITYIVAAGFLAGCAQTADLQASATGKDKGAPPSLAQFTDIPIPAGATMNMERSLILGPHDTWIGRLVYTTSLGPQQVFAFFGREMPGFGWREITQVRARISILTFVRGDRAATIQIDSTTLGGAAVDFTVSPARAESPAPARR
jgi:hypothetical protein